MTFKKFTLLDDTPTTASDRTWIMKAQVLCTQCQCLVPEDWIDDKQKQLCYMCTPMTKEDWNYLQR